MTTQQMIEEAVKEFENTWEDKGDDRYGLVKHNNTIVERQADWLRTTLEKVAEAAAGEAMTQEAIKCDTHCEEARQAERQEILSALNGYMSHGHEDPCKHRLCTCHKI